MAPREYLGRFYVDSLVHDADALRYLVQLIGAERIALGSDYPFPLGRAVPGALIESMDGSSTPRRRSGCCPEPRSSSSPCPRERFLA